MGVPTLKLCLLGSGSSGNCTYVAGREAQILVDAGIPFPRIASELVAIGSDPARIDALVLSHEHGDHCREARRVACDLGCPVYVSHRTLDRIRWALGPYEAIRTFRVGEAFEVSDLRIETFRVFHDAVDPCGFVVAGPSHRKPGPVKAAMAVDLGAVTPQLLARFRDCEALVIESNHDLEMLMGGDYPWDLKQRIRSPVGHLSNEAAAALIAELLPHGRLEKVVLAHLSQNNNRPELALETVRLRLDAPLRCELTVAPCDKRSELLEL